MENIKQIIKSFKYTYITLDTIEKIIKPKDYSELVEYIEELIKDGILMPVKVKNNTNGRIPFLFMKYRIVKDVGKLNSLEIEIKSLAPELRVDKYLKNKDIYEKHREYLLVLDDFFKTKRYKLDIKLSKNERAYQIWKYEKFLDSPIGKSILSYNELEEKLNYYLTPEPFFDYILTNKPNMTMLIIENKDAWYSFRKVMKEFRKCKIFNCEIDGIIYGEGNKITAPEAVQNYEREMLNSKALFWYWGDIDFAGVDMYQRMKVVNPNCNIKLFTKIYEKMLDIVLTPQQIHKIQNKNVKLSEFFYEFENDIYRNRLEEVFKNNCYIPQEVLNYEEIKKLFMC